VNLDDKCQASSDAPAPRAGTPTSASRCATKASRLRPRREDLISRTARATCKLRLRDGVPTLRSTPAARAHAARALCGFNEQLMIADWRRRIPPQYEIGRPRSWRYWKNWSSTTTTSRAGRARRAAPGAPPDVSRLRPLVRIGSRASERGPRRRRQATSRGRPGASPLRSVAA